MDHSAKEQLLGYVYQVEYALVLLLESSDENAQISIEKFDDIAFAKEGTPVELIQTKHHIVKRADLTDCSPDLWRTLKVWIDACTRSEELLAKTRFLLITTSIASENSVCDVLRKNGNRLDKEIDRCYSLLLEVAKTSANVSLKPYFKAFLDFDEQKAKSLLKNMYVIDGSPQIAETETRIRNSLRFACKPQHEDALYARVLGAWYDRCIRALSSSDLELFSLNEIRSLIIDLASEYKTDNLPLYVAPGVVDKLVSSVKGDETFCRQLGLINSNEGLMCQAINEYCRASAQRTEWIEGRVITPEELQRYENLLIDEWRFERSICQSGLGSGADEMEKREVGMRLYTETMKKQLFIRDKCREGFVMRGSYHILSDDLQVGWHIDYEERLKKNDDDK